MLSSLLGCTHLGATTSSRPGSNAPPHPYPCPIPAALPPVRLRLCASPVCAGHYEQLHSALLRFSSPGAGQGLLLQDISSNNLLVSELVSFGAVGKAASTAAPSCELLFADPSQAQIIGHLQKPQA